MTAYRMSLVIFWKTNAKIFSSLLYPFSKLLELWGSEVLQTCKIEDVEEIFEAPEKLCDRKLENHWK